VKNDPENLPTDYAPAVVAFRDGTEHVVANQSVTDQGWLYVIGWAGSRRRYPPHRIAHVEFADVNRVSGDGRAWIEMTDEDLVAEAKRAAGLYEDRTAEALTAVAGGSETPHPDAGGGSGG